MEPIPHPPRVPFLGNAPQVLMASTVVDGIQAQLDRYGPIVELQMPAERVLVVGSHALGAELCDEERFCKVVGAPLKAMRGLVGDGLITVDNEAEVWGHAHRILRPAFTREAMKRYVDMMVEVTDAMVTRWRQAEEGEAIDAADAMSRLTFDTIALCGFGARLRSFERAQVHPFIPAVGRAMAELPMHVRRPGPMKVLNALHRGELEADIQLASDFVDALIRERREHPERFEDDESLLNLMLRTADPKTGAHLSDENIRHQALTFLLAGHETTTNLLAYALYAIARHPAVQDALVEEVDRVMGPADGPPPDYKTILKLRYARQVLEESMRVCPPVAAFVREAVEDTQLGGRYAVPKGQRCLFFINAVHRDPAAWGEDAEAFQPERFGPGQRAPEHAFKPFGTGPRACIGRQFSLFEATLALGRIFQSFRVAEAPGSKLELSYPLTTKVSGVKLRLSARA
ncbi:MAG: cytochrome P450 [Alphaproteobacteria bacterium]|nr:cytochrome P450 [Alphaproteobacteria bacterium]